MADKLRLLEDRLDRLEDKLRTTFLEVEKRFEETKSEESEVMTVEARIQEIEDLLLLLQLEITKMKEKTGGLDFSPTPVTDDVHERVAKLEAAVSASVAGPAMATHNLGEIDERMSRIEKKLNQPLTVTGMQEIERRLERLERAQASQPGHILEDVRKVLTS